MAKREWEKRGHRRFMREQMQSLAWVFIASPILVLILGQRRYSIVEIAFMPVVGLLMLAWFRRNPGLSEHIASVEHVHPNDPDGPDARTTPFYLAWCDCGWNGGTDHPDERSARSEARRHTEHVRDGLHAFGE